MHRRPRISSWSVASVIALASASCDRAQAPVAPLPLASSQSSIGTLAFTSDRDGNNQIYLMNPDGTGQTRLTNNTASDVDPRWSPDGTRLVFTSNRDGNNEIYVMNADGTGQTRLTNNTANDRRPALCGNRIAFDGNGYGGFPNVYVMNDDGTGVTRLTISNAAFEYSAAWSPGCDRIAFTSDDGGHPQIYVMNPDGTGRTRLTNNAGSDYSPVWSPDGGQIAFFSDRDFPQSTWQIYVMNADGTGQTRLTNDPHYDAYPAWSPDGRQIAFASNRDGNYEIYVMNADGTGQTRLTNTAADEFSPTWFGPAVVATGSWPNEPAGLRAYNDQPWDSLAGVGWSYVRRTSSKDADIFADATAPLSPQNVLRIIFTTDMEPNSEPGVNWISLPSVKSVFTAWWIKLSSDWTADPASAGMMTYLFTSGSGVVNTSYYHPCTYPEVCSPETFGPPYKIGVATQWAPYGQQVWYPNVETTWINPGEWHRIEVFYQWETDPQISGDGIIRWWVDGRLNGDYMAVHYPPDSFVELQYAPSRQNAPPTEQYMYIDHTYVSAP